MKFLSANNAYAGPLYAYIGFLHAYAYWGMHPYELMNADTYTSRVGAYA